MSGYRKKPSEQGVLTSWRQLREGLVRTQKEKHRSRRTHWESLETPKGRTCQDMERNRLSEAHPLAEDGRGRDSSRHRKKPTEQGALTSLRRQREGFFRIQNENDRARHTHHLEMAEGETYQDTERRKPSEGHGHSHTGKFRGKAKLVWRPI